MQRPVLQAEVLGVEPILLVLDALVVLLQLLAQDAHLLPNDHTHGML